MNLDAGRYMGLSRPLIPLAASDSILITAYSNRFLIQFGGFGSLASGELFSFPYHQRSKSKARSIRALPYRRSRAL